MSIMIGSPSTIKDTQGDALLIIGIPVPEPKIIVCMTFIIHLCEGGVDIKACFAPLDENERGIVYSSSIFQVVFVNGFVSETSKRHTLMWKCASIGCFSKMAS
jgi:hypothetical protein